MVSVNLKPTPRQLREFGVISVVATVLLGCWVFFWQRLFWFDFEAATAELTAFILWGVGAYCGLCTLVAPIALLPIYLTLTLVALPIGIVVTNVVLVLFYYGMLVPVGLFFRLRGRDALERRIDPQADSYWVKREPVTDVKRYFRQF